MNGLPIKLRPMSDIENWGHEIFAFKPDIDNFEHVAVTKSKAGAQLLSVKDIYNHPNSIYDRSGIHRRLRRRRSVQRRVGRDLGQA